MELTKRERALLAQARSNPYSREPRAKFLLGFFAIVLASVSVAAWLGAAGWDDVSRALVFLWVGAQLYQYTAAQADAWSLIAKLDGSYDDRVPPQPAALGLGPTGRGADQDPG